MQAVHDPWKFFVGTTWKIWVTCSDEDGVPIHLVGSYSLTWLLDDKNGTRNFIRLTNGDGITVLYPQTGEVLIEVSSEKTRALLPGYYLDELTLVLDGDASVQAYGVIEAARKLNPMPAIVPSAAVLRITSSPPLVT